MSDSNPNLAGVRGRFRATVKPTGRGTVVLSLVDARGMGGAGEYPTQKAAFAAIGGFCQLTSEPPPAVAPATDAWRTA